MEFQENQNAIDQQINDLDRLIRKHAEDTLHQIYDEYHRMLVERINHELALTEDRRAVGDSTGARRHQILADIWTSLLKSDAIALPRMQDIPKERATE